MNKILIVTLLLIVLSMSACSTLLDITGEPINEQIIEPVIVQDYKYDKVTKTCYCLDEDRLAEAKDELFNQYEIIHYDKVEDVDVNKFNFIVITVTETEEDGYQRQEKVYPVKINLATVEDCHQSDYCRIVEYVE